LGFGFWVYGLGLGLGVEGTCLARAQGRADDFPIVVAAQPALPATV